MRNISEFFLTTVCFTIARSVVIASVSMEEVHKNIKII